MKSSQIIKKYLDFYKSKNHHQVPNVSLVPEGDSTLLYVNSGMFPLVPYLMGQKHPAGKRLMNFQRCIRFFDDIDNVGETIRHTTCFHMFGNWSLNDYFKPKQILWVMELFIEVFGMDPQRLYATVFKGNNNASVDKVSIELIKKAYQKYNIIAEEGQQIFLLGEDDNWWKRGDAPGELGGPSFELYYYLGSNGKNGTGLGLDITQHENDFLEIGNSVFMEYIKDDQNNWTPMKTSNVDFGGGLERVALVLQNKTDIFETDNFWNIIKKIEELSGYTYKEDSKLTKAMRILADHIRSATLIAMDGVVPANKDQGYVLRRLLRRIVRYGLILGIKKDISTRLVNSVIEILDWAYPELSKKNNQISQLFADEEARFRQVLQKVAPKVQQLLRNAPQQSLKNLAKEVFDLYQSAGYPQEMFFNEMKEQNIDVDLEQLQQEYKKLFIQHQTLSRQGAEQKFKGGLADNSEQVTKYHTTTHLLNAGLRHVLGDQICQKGSNITGERLRFDFPHNAKLTPEEVKRVEDWINQQIINKLLVSAIELTKEEAEKTGAVHTFNEKYGNKVTVYFIGKNLTDCISKEFCGGPHVMNTSVLDHVEIYKQESVGKGVKRVYVRAIVK